MTPAAYLTEITNDLAHCRTRVGPAVRQLHEWCGGYARSVIGANPNTAGTSSSTPGDTGTSIPVDKHRQDLDRLTTNLADIAQRIYALCKADNAPKVSAEPDKAAAILVGWCLVELSAYEPVAAPGSTHVDYDALRRQETALRALSKLTRRARIAVDNAKPPERVTIVDNCHAHQAADLEAPISPNYRKWHLCRWCGDFRAHHGVRPPVKLVKLHDRGIRITTSHLRNAGVKTNAPNT